MECTQRLECTQQYGTHSQNERLFPEQIGFLGICGTKYPVKKGPNKIGRDPQTCNIVLKLHSVSRQHAVINILNNKDFMLMDLDSANKTKLSGVTLQPYIPHPLQNGDTVQFGEIFGIFRLLEEETDLPMTQAIDIPETPVPTKHISRINAVTTIPESPDVSDRDDSFIAPSQLKGHQFQGSKTRNFIKPGKTISIQPMGTNKIDNVYWSSSKKSTSLNLDESMSSLDDSMLPDKLYEKENDVVNDIHELETQEVFATPKLQNICTNLIHTVDTQLPDLDNAGPSIHTANTQMPGATNTPCMHSLDTQGPCELISPSIHNLNTQMPGAISSPDVPLSPGSNLPEVCKINEQQDMQIDLCANKENDVSIYNAGTQLSTVKKENVLTDFNNMIDSPTRVQTNSKLNVSNDEILFDEIDNLPCGDFESQPLLSEDIDLPINRLVEPEPELESQSQIVMPKCAKRSMRIKSDSSTDCEDPETLTTLKVNKNKDDDDDNTDCEEELCKLKINKNETCKAKSSKSAEHFEEMATQVIMLDEELSKSNTDVNFEDMPTQVIEFGDIEENAKIDKSNMGFEDLATQVIDIPLKKHNGSNQLSMDEDSPFKVPFNSSMKGKKYVSKTPKIKLITFNSNTNLINGEHNRYYQDTQDIYEDLCTQKIDLPDVVPEKNITSSSNKPVVKFDGQNSHHSKPTNLMLDTSFNNMDPEENVNDFVSNLSSQEVRDVIGIDTLVASVKKVPSDSSTTSDVEITPKKQRLFKFSDIDLPNSEEIKSIVSLTTRDDVTESSSESDTEVNTEEQCTPILFRKKRKTKIDSKLDLTKKFDIEALPSRVITRVRKPTAKFQDLELKKAAENILKPKFVTEQEGEISKEIITENISRLKSKNEKIKNSINNKDSDKEIKHADSKKETKQTGSKNERKQFNSSKDTKQDISNNDIKHTNSNKETKTGLSKENKYVRSSKETEHAASNDEIKQTDLKKDTKQVASNIENKQADTIKETKLGNSHERIELAASREVSKQTVSNKTMEQTGSSKETRPGCSSKEPIQIDMEKETKDHKVIREHSSRRTGEKEKMEKKPTERTKMSSYVDKRRKREPKNRKMESEERQSDTTVNNTVQSLNSTVESKDKTNSCGKSKDHHHTSDLISSPVETKRSTRSARTAKTKKTETKSASPERDSQNSQGEKPNKRKYTRKKETKELTKEEKEPSHVKEVRRSKRQRTIKDTKEEPMKVIKSILKKSVMVPHEESAVYNTSSGSNSDTSRSFKRPALDDGDVPSAKKTRSTVTHNTSLRATPVKPVITQYVLFTAFPYEAVKVKLEKLGAVVTTDLMNSTVVLTRQIKRTFKLLCAVGLGKPIVGPSWVQACADNNTIVDPWLYLMKDEAAEKRFHFSLERTLTGKRNFLERYTISATPSVMPEPHEMKVIVECSGGVWKEGGPQWICVTVPDDQPLWPDLRDRGAILVSTEFILGGVLRQRVDINANKYKI